MSNTTIFNLSDLGISIGRINVKSKKNNLVSVYSNTISKYYSATVTNGLSIDNVVLYDGQDNTGTQLGVLLMGETETYTITSGYIFAEWDNPLTIGDVSFTSDGSDVGNPLRVNANKTLGLSVVTTYLTFSSNDSFTIATANNTKNWDGILYYSIDATTWNTWNGATINSSNNGMTKYLYIRGKNNTKITGDSTPTSNRWVLTGTNISCSGDIIRLLDYEWDYETTPTTSNYCFCGLFYNNTNLLSAPTLNRNLMQRGLYMNMFYNCESLTTAPALPSTSVQTECYSYMFSGCTSLVTAPNLPAKIMATGCYKSMFNSCTSLTIAPQLPATTLANECYQSMFAGCTSLTTAPELHLTSLADYCYASMFTSCTALTTPAKMGGGTSQANPTKYSCQHMYNGCTSLNIYTSASGHTAFYKSMTYSTSSSAYNYRSTYRMFYNCKINGTTSTTNYLTAGTQYYY